MASRLLPLALLALLATVAAAATVVTINADGSVTFDGYTLKTDGTVTDAKGAPVTPTDNGDGSYSINGVYTKFANGTLKAPGVAIYADPVGLSVGATTVYANGTVVDSTGLPVFGTVNADKSYTVNDVTGFANGTIVATDGTVVNTGLPLTVDEATGVVSVATPPEPPAPAPAPAPPPPPPAKVTTVVTINPDRTVTVDGYKILKNLTVLDPSGAVVTPTPNADGSSSVNGYTLYPNKTLIVPGVAVTLGDPFRITIGATTFFSDGLVTDAAGESLYGTLNKDQSVTVGDLTGWSNGTIVGNNGAVVHTGLQLTADPTSGVISVLTASPPPVPSPPPPSPPAPPKPAASLSSHASWTAAVVALLAAPLFL